MRACAALLLQLAAGVGAHRPEWQQRAVAFRVGERSGRGQVLLGLQEAAENGSTAAMARRLPAGRFLDRRGRPFTAAEFAKELIPGRSIGLKYSEAGEELYHERVLLGPVGASGDGLASIWRSMTPDLMTYEEQ